MQRRELRREHAEIEQVVEISNSKMESLKIENIHTVFKTQHLRDQEHLVILKTFTYFIHIAQSIVHIEFDNYKMYVMNVICIKNYDFLLRKTRIKKQYFYLVVGPLREGGELSDH